MRLALSLGSLAIVGSLFYDVRVLRGNLVDGADSWDAKVNRKTEVQEHDALY
jgi:hypothetical protein